MDAYFEEIERLTKCCGWHFDVASNRLWMSNGLRAELGSTPKNVWNLMAICPADQRMELRHAVKNMIRNHVKLDLEIRVGTPGKSDRWLRLLAIPRIKDNKLISLNGAVVDISDKKLIEIELQRAIVAAALANRTKSDLLANITHEIRTPLTAIAGFTELVVEESVDKSEREEFCRRIFENVQAVSGIVNDIIEYTKIESSQITLAHDQFTVGALRDECVRILTEKIGRKDLKQIVELRGDAEASVLNDWQRLLQSFTAIADNAVKFSSAGGNIEIIFTIEPRNKKDFLIIEVADKGVGIAQDKLDIVFNAFTQADGSYTRHHGGIGLGLTFARQLAEKLGGGVRVLESTVGQGTKIEIAVLRQVAAAADESRGANLVSMTDLSGLVTSHAPAPAREKPFAGMSILVTEDVDDIKKFIGIILSKSGASVEFAVNGLDAINKVLAKQFDLVLMDLQMPVLDGLKAVAMIRAANCKTPIIALTAHATREDQERCLRNGFTDFMSKPIRREALMNKIMPFVKDHEDPLSMLLGLNAG